MSANVNIRTLKKAPSQNDYESLCGLDALYFFIKIDYNDYTRFYLNHLLKTHLESDDFVLISKNYQNQFTFFQHFGNIPNDTPEGFARSELCRIGFKNLNERDNLHQIQVQMNSTALQQMNIDDIISYFTKLLNSLGLVPLKFQISRVDLNNYLFDFPFHWLKYDFFSTKIKKSESKFNGNRLETFYLGSRGNGLFLRIYDKLQQLKSLEYVEGTTKEYLIGKKYIQKYHKAPNYEHLWNVEIELRREQLKLYKIDTLEDLNKNVNILFKTIFRNSIRLLQEVKNMDTHDNRVSTHSVWTHIINEFDYNGSPVVSLEKEKQKEYKRDNAWLKNRLLEFLEEPKNNDFEVNKKVHELLDLLNQNPQISLSNVNFNI